MVQRQGRHTEPAASLALLGAARTFGRKTHSTAELRSLLAAAGYTTFNGPSRYSNPRLNAGETLAGTEMFVDELVRSILVDRRAEQLVVSLVGPVMNEQFQAAANHYGASDRLRLYSGPGTAG